MTHDADGSDFRPRVESAVEYPVYGRVLDEYGASRPGEAEAIGELGQLGPDRQEQFAESMLFSVARPPEVAHNTPEREGAAV